ncbi:pentapeptide repeat-containing protein [Streptomyces sp. NPDC006638]|uniref:pentapeptide repeat-containing protein n=1 Tax=Streptomyces sp. NPDC006638 TaxID=3157183 RepID=UPI00339EE6F2
MGRGRWSIPWWPGGSRRGRAGPPRPYGGPARGSRRGSPPAARRHAPARCAWCGSPGWPAARRGRPPPRHVPARGSPPWRSCLRRSCRRRSRPWRFCPWRSCGAPFAAGLRRAVLRRAVLRRAVLRRAALRRAVLR